MTSSNEDSPTLGAALVRGLKLRCPKCGQGRLLAGYLQQVDACETCGLPIGDIRADDGPPWLTLLVVGHLLAPFLALLFMSDALPLWLSTALMCVLAVGLCLALLPRSKGVFIAAIWKLGASHTSDDDTVPD